MTEIYLDNNATTRPLPEVREAMLAILGDDFGNPSSAHSSGERARTRLLAAREALAGLLNVSSESMVFTGTGTEANNVVLRSFFTPGTPGQRLVTTPIEHSSIIKTADWLEQQNVQVDYLPVDAEGRVDPQTVTNFLSQPADLVSIQWVNNETGVIQPVEEIAGICSRAAVPFHTDAAQAVGKIPIDLEDSEIAFLTLTAHKFNGPQGIGAIYMKETRSLKPIVFGGPQEHGLRAGTENLPGIVGLGVAARLRHEGLEESLDHLSHLRRHFEARVLDKVPAVLVNGGRAERAVNTSNLLFLGLDGQALVARLDEAGIRCSQSSACTNQRPEPSYVLRKMGLSESDAYSSVRFSFAVDNTLEEVNIAAAAVVRLCELLRPLSTTSMTAAR